MEPTKIRKIEIYLAVIFGLMLTIGIVIFISSLFPGPHDEFARCLTQNGVKFYGSFWCPHCAEQKEILGNSMKYIDYIECSTQDLQRTQVCIDANITKYPTWEFANGSRVVAVVPLENLSKFSGCELAK